VVQWNAFTSTSLSETVAITFSERGVNKKNPVIFDIRRTANHPTAANISAHATEEYQWEKEVLMIPGCRFVVVSIDDQCSPVRIILKERVLQCHK
jgi:hypothetical protein